MTDFENVRLSRRAVLTGAAGGAAALTLATSPLARASTRFPFPFPTTAPWTLPGHDLAGSRFSNVRAGIGSERWRVHMPGGVTGAPLIWNRRVLAASFGGDVASFDLETGRQRWRQSFGTATYGTGDDARQLGFFGGIAVEGNRIIVASDRARCLDAVTGATIWEAPPLRPAGGDDYFWAPPVIAGLTVILGSGAGSEATSTRGRVTAYSLIDGRLLWSTPMVPVGGNGGGVLSQPTVDLARRTIYAATGAPYAPTATNIPGTDSLVALDLFSGRVLWSDQVHAADQLGYDLNSAPVLIGPSIVAVAGKDGFHAWDRRSHRRLWDVRTTPQSPAPGSPADPTTGPRVVRSRATAGASTGSRTTRRPDRAWPPRSTPPRVACSGRRRCRRSRSRRPPCRTTCSRCPAPMARSACSRRRPARCSRTWRSASRARAR